ncbi:MAG: hypothetical protein M1376_19155 [Planctomycetes bacterium]|nr:hypothetical protein [Planctomycetota bacterium]
MRDRMLDDTTPEALAVQFQVLRRIGPAGRLAMMFELSDNLRQITKDGVRHHHPDWDDRAVEREVMRLMMGDDLFRQAYGKEPTEP